MFSFFRFVQEWKKYLEYEAEVMKDVPGWKVGESVYNSGRWMPPATAELRPEVWWYLFAAVSFVVNVCFSSIMCLWHMFVAPFLRNKVQQKPYLHVSHAYNRFWLLLSVTPLSHYFQHIQNLKNSIVNALFLRMSWHWSSLGSLSPTVKVAIGQKIASVQIVGRDLQMKEIDEC